MLLNRSRALEYMRRVGVEALVSTSPENITYFSNYHSWLDPLFREYMGTPGASSSLAENFALLPLEGEPALVVSATMVANTYNSWIKDIYPTGGPLCDTTLTGPLQGDFKRM